MRTSRVATNQGNRVWKRERDTDRKGAQRPPPSDWTISTGRGEFARLMSALWSHRGVVSFFAFAEKPLGLGAGVVSIYE